MKEKILTVDELKKDIERIKADMEWASKNGIKELEQHFNFCLREKEKILKERCFKNETNDCII